MTARIGDRRNTDAQSRWTTHVDYLLTKFTASNLMYMYLPFKSIQKVYYCLYGYCALSQSMDWASTASKYEGNSLYLHWFPS